MRYIYFSWIISVELSWYERNVSAPFYNHKCELSSPPEYSKEGKKLTMKVQDNEKQGEGEEEIIEPKSSGTLEKKDLKKTDNLDSEIQDQDINKKPKTDTLTSESDVASNYQKNLLGK